MKNWKMVKLGEIFIRLTRKNIENNTNVLTISAKHGLVNQEEFFSKSIASDNKSNYFLLYKGDFAYNKSYSSGYPFGTIKVLTKYEKGIVSPLYICFSPSPENHCPEFYLQYFESGFMNKKIQAIAQEGARNHGLLNIGIDDFFNIPVPLPPIEIQQKIADILSTQDKLIELKQNLINQKKQQKKWLMQNLLTGKIRLKGFSGKWISTSFDKIGEIVSGGTPDTSNTEYWNGNILWCTPTDITNSGKYICDTEKKITELGLNNSSANLLPINSILMCSRATIGPRCINTIPMATNQGFKSIILNNDKANVNYVYDLIELCIEDFIALSSGSTFLELSKKDFKKYKITIPPIEEQTAIAEILSNQDKEIELLEKQLEQEKLKKKALMQLLLSDV